MTSTFHSLLPLAFALLASLAVGRLASRFGVPRVTAYLLVGLGLGPHGLAQLLGHEGAAGAFVLGPGTEAPLRAVSHLAIGFILFGIGAEFRFEALRRAGPRVIGLSAVEIGLTSVLVGLAVLAGTGDWRVALVAPALAIATAPSATLVTLREVEAEGPAARSLLLLVGHNNLAALLLFPVLLGLAFGTGAPGGGPGLALLSLGVGAAIGFVAAIWLEAIDGRRELVIFGILVVVALLGLADRIQSDAVGLGMLGCFGAGLALTNASPHAGRLQRYLENTIYPLYVLFFIAAGRDLHLDALAAAGVLGFAFVLARAVGKVAGIHLGLRLVGWQGELPPRLGAGLLCQAGVALGLVAALEVAAPEETAELRSVVVASVVVFELFGPWLLRRTVVAAGEVKLANLVPHAEATGVDAVRWVMVELRRNLGILVPRTEGNSAPTTVGHAMRRRPTVVRENLSFDRVLKILGETHADLVPVLDGEGLFRGVISYDEVKNTLYDPSLQSLVIAEDITTRVEEPLDPEMPLDRALESMDARRVQSWPVVSEGRLVGMLRRSDAYALMRRALRSGSS